MAVVLRQGEIYWVIDCPPLDGSAAMPHAVIVLNPTEQLRDMSQPVRVMVVSSSVKPVGEGDIPLPNSQTDARCSTGLTKPCWAVARWVLRINDRSRLGRRAGYVSGSTLRRIITSYASIVRGGHGHIEYP